MSTQISQESPGEIRREMKSQLDAVKAAAEKRPWSGCESGDSRDARAFRRPPKPFIAVDGEVDVYGDMGENDSLGG